MSGAELHPRADPGGRAAIEAAIPHRAPFLFLDRVLEWGEDSIRVAWRVPPEADFFRGHYPGQPVTPGALLCEHAFQAAACLISRALGGFEEEDGVPVLTKIEGSRFRRMVLPGDKLETEVKVRERLGPAWYLTATVRCDEKTAVQTRFVLTATGALSKAIGGEG